MRIWVCKKTGKLVYKDEMIRDFEKEFKKKYDFYFHHDEFEKYSQMRCHHIHGDLVDKGECY